MQVTIRTADGREIHPSINPAPAGLNRTLRRTRPSAFGTRPAAASVPPSWPAHRPSPPAGRRSGAD